MSFVDIAVHMNRKGGNHKEIAVDIDQTLFNALFRADAYPAGAGERAVEPGSGDHAAVTLGIEANAAFGFQLRIHFDFEGRAVTVAGTDHETAEVGFRYTEGNECRAVPRHVVSPAAAQLPFGSFRKRFITVLFEQFPDGFYRMERSW